METPHRIFEVFPLPSPSQKHFNLANKTQLETQRLMAFGSLTVRRSLHWRGCLKGSCEERGFLTRRHLILREGSAGQLVTVKQSNEAKELGIA